MLDIHELMKGLSERRPIFHSEADFQFALAWQIRDSDPESAVRLEFPLFQNSREKIDLDIWIPSEGTAVEVKYPKSDLDIPLGDERFVLKTGNDDDPRYGFVKDVERLERIVEDFDDAERGFAVLLTNHKPLWKIPATIREDANDAEFRIHEGAKIGGSMNWDPKGTSKTKRPSISLEVFYSTHWRNYRDLCTKNSHFRYLAVEVGK